MNDSQIIALSITVLAILGATLVNNSRIGHLNGRVSDARDVIWAEVDARFAKLDLSLEIRFNAMVARFNLIDRKLDELLRVVANHDHRIRSIEERPR
jgi:low affinity Fe/Cu permease